MELSTSAKEAIYELRTDYERQNRLADLEFLCTVFDIMDKEEGFRDVLSYEVIDNSRNLAYEMVGRVVIDLSNALKETSYLSNIFKCYYDKERIIPVRNMFMLAIMFHEFTHVSEEFGFSEIADVNKYFESFYAKNRTLIYKLMRLFNNNAMMDERYANAHTYRLLSDIYPGGYLNQILGDAYFAMVDGNIKHKHFENSIKRLKLYQDNLASLPLITRLDLGVPLSSLEEEQVKKLTRDIWTSRNSFSGALNILKNIKD